MEGYSSRAEIIIMNINEELCYFKERGLLFTQLPSYYYYYKEVILSAEF